MTCINYWSHLALNDTTMIIPTLSPPQEIVSPPETLHFHPENFASPRPNGQNTSHVTQQEGGARYLTQAGDVFRQYETRDLCSDSNVAGQFLTSWLRLCWHKGVIWRRDGSRIGFFLATVDPRDRRYSISRQTWRLFVRLAFLSTSKIWTMCEGLRHLGLFFVFP